jgi:hypothetical protein
VGSHSTFPFLEVILPALAELAKSHSFKLKIVGAGRADVSIPGVEVENLEWSLEREVEDFSVDRYWLYPLSAENKLGIGEDGFKGNSVDGGLAFPSSVSPIAAAGNWRAEM